MLLSNFILNAALQPQKSTVDSTDPLDRVISIIIVLFILSVITEKLTQLVRTYPRQFRALGLIFCGIGYLTIGSSTVNAIKTSNTDHVWTIFFLFVFITVVLIIILANIDFVHPVSAPKAVKRFRVLQNVGRETLVDDKVKEKEVTVLSFLIGFFVAFCFKMNLITLFNGTMQLGWGDDQFFESKKILVIDPKVEIEPLLIFSFMLTAFFLAFGSKFFHDLLDNLLEIKNLKRKAFEKETYQVTSIKEFDDQLAKTTYDKNAAAIASLPGVTGLSFGRLREDGSGRFGLKVFTSNPDLVLKSDLIRDTNGKRIPVYVDAEESAELVSVSAKVSNAKQGAENGTICIGVREVNNTSAIYLLTCYHVVRDGQDWTQFAMTPGKSDQVNVAGGLTGTIVKATRNQEMDAALIRLVPSAPIDNTIPAFNVKITSSRPTLFFDDDATRVNVYGAATQKKRSGLITGLGARWKINFRDGSARHEMVNLIEIQQDGHSIVRGGDSGALIFTDEGEALGMVVASTKKRTLAIPIQTILTNWNLEIIT